MKYREILIFIMILQKNKGEMLKYVRFVPCDFNSEL